MSDPIAYLDALTSCQSMEDLWEMHTAKMAEYGFDRLIYGFTRYRTSHSLGDPQDWVMLTNQSRDYMQTFIDDGLLFHAPMVKWALANTGVCSWSWLHEMAKSDSFTASESKAIEFNRKMDVIAGYTISFKSISERSKGAIALTARKGMSQEETDQVWVKFGPEIIVMNNVAHLKILSLPYSGARHLTSRQREVLQWVGDGKTTQDIAILLDLTAATIEKHLRLAREALDVETTAQAVLKAAFYNQMFIVDA